MLRGFGLVSYWQGVEQDVFNFLGVRGMTLHRPGASSSFPRRLSSAKAGERESNSTVVMWTPACAGVTTSGAK